MIKEIYNMIKLAYVSSNASDSSAYPKLQVTFNGKPTNAIRLEPYGFWSMPPAGSLAVCLSAQGYESTLFAISNDYINRPKNLNEGEVLHGAFSFGAFTYYDNQGQTSLIGETVYVGSLTVDLVKTLKDTLAAIQLLTVPTAVGASGVPINAATFAALETAIDTILTEAPSVN